MTPRPKVLVVTLALALAGCVGTAAPSDPGSALARPIGGAPVSSEANATTSAALRPSAPSLETDKIAILSDVASPLKGCGARGQDRGESAQDIARWMAGEKTLDVTAPAPVSVGGLDGFLVDVRLDPTATRECFPIPGVILFSGLGPSEGIAEGIVAGTVTRRLLDHGDDVVAIVIADVSGGDHLADFTSAATAVEFQR